MRHRYGCLLFAAAVATCFPAWAAAPLQVSPTEARLQGRFSRAQLLVRNADARDPAGRRSADLTGTATYETSDPLTVAVNEHGQLLAIGNGTARVTVKAGDLQLVVPVTVSGVDSQPPDFNLAVQPLLSRYGCNAAACHAGQFGKGGLIISVMGYDPQANRGTAPFENCDNTLKLAESLGVGTCDLKRIEVVGASIESARFPFATA